MDARFSDKFRPQEVDFVTASHSDLQSVTRQFGHIDFMCLSALRRSTLAGLSNSARNSFANSVASKASANACVSALSDERATLRKRKLR